MPASEQALRDAEKAMSLKRLPEEYRQWLLANEDDGTFMCIEEVVDSWSSWIGVMEDADNEGMVAVGPVRAQFYNRAWIPVTYDANCYVLDLDPKKGGAFGQVVSVGASDGERVVVAASFTHLLRRLQEQPDVDAWRYEDIADEVTKTAAAQSFTKKDFVAPLRDPTDFKKGEIVTGVVESWPQAGIHLVADGKRLIVYGHEINWLGGASSPDPSIATIGAPLRVQVQKWDRSERAWLCSLRALQPDPLEQNAALFAIGTRHRARVSYVGNLEMSLQLEGSLVRVWLRKTVLDDYDLLRSGNVLNVEVIGREGRAIEVRSLDDPRTAAEAQNP